MKKTSVLKVIFLVWGTFFSINSYAATVNVSFCVKKNVTTFDDYTTGDLYNISSLYSVRGIKVNVKQNNVSKWSGVTPTVDISSGPGAGCTPSIGIESSQDVTLVISSEGLIESNGVSSELLVVNDEQSVTIRNFVLQAPFFLELKF